MDSLMAATPDFAERNRQRGEKFMFEGELLTVREVHERVPVLSMQTVRGLLRRGLDKRTDMLAIDRDAIRARNGRKAAQRYKCGPR